MRVLKKKKFTLIQKGFSLQNYKVLPNWISNGNFNLFPYGKNAKAQNTQKILKGGKRNMLLCFYFAVFFIILQTSLNY